MELLLLWPVLAFALWRTTRCREREWMAVFVAFNLTMAVVTPGAEGWYLLLTLFWVAAWAVEAERATDVEGESLGHL